jgi:hypothetical protein
MYTNNSGGGVHLQGNIADVFREEPIPFVIYNNELRSKLLVA